MAEGWNLIAVASLTSVSVEEYLEGYDWRAVYGYVEENRSREKATGYILTRP